VRIRAIRFPSSGRSPARADRDDQIASMAEELAAQRAIVDVLNVGTVVLDKDGRVTFMNRAFHYFWRVPVDMVGSDLTFDELMRNGRGMKAYAIGHERVEEYLLKKIDLIRSGEDRPSKSASATALSFSSAAKDCPMAAIC
jgi:PAS domain-containing protein